MSRSAEQRVADVRRLLAASRSVYERRALLVDELVRTTGLTPEGVKLGFELLERDAGDDELRALVAAAPQVEHVHVVLSANVFVAPVRALALARAASERVTVRPSPRDPVLARAVVEALRDDAVAIVAERDVAAVDRGEIHVYGRDETIAAVRSAARPGVVVRGHGAGLGVAVVTHAADVDRAAASLAPDVVAFDQRGCLSPRIAFVEGDEERAFAFAEALHDQLGAWQARVPRGEPTPQERADSARWCDTLAFVGRLRRGAAHAVASLPPGAALAVPPTGRHVLVVGEPTLAAIAARIAPIARVVVAAGSDDPARASTAVPSHARASVLGRMQRPPLDGPVDRRSL